MEVERRAAPGEGTLFGALRSGWSWAPAGLGKQRELPGGRVMYGGSSSMVCPPQSGNSRSQRKLLKILGRSIACVDRKLLRIHRSLEVSHSRTPTTPERRQRSGDSADGSVRATFTVCSRPHHPAQPHGHPSRLPSLSLSGHGRGPGWPPSGPLFQFVL